MPLFVDAVAGWGELQRFQREGLRGFAYTKLDTHAHTHIYGGEHSNCFLFKSSKLNNNVACNVRL